MTPVSDTRLEIDPGLLQQLRGVELKSRFLVRGLYSSRHRTADRGASTEFIEHRQYRKGDALRTIDWRVLARTDRLHVKVHEMEANLRVHLLLDASQSMRVPPPTGLPSKLELASVAAGAIAILAEGQQEAVGLICLGDRLEEFIPPRQGPAHLNLLLQHLGRPSGKGGGNLGQLVQQVSPRLGRRGVVFLLTDALDSPDDLLAGLQQLRVREQDVTVIQILDKNEVEFPFERLTEFRHPESGDRVIGDPSALRARYLERLQAHLEQVERCCKKAQAEYLFLHNGTDLNRLLSLHFLRRMIHGGY
jgi:uncharacterized protein (DUF58 family)